MHNSEVVKDAWLESGLFCRFKTEPYDTDKMASELAMQFAPSRLALTLGQRIVLQMPGREPLTLTVKEIQG